jgi:hypothetical protein
MNGGPYRQLSYMSGSESPLSAIIALPERFELPLCGTSSQMVTPREEVRAAERLRSEPATEVYSAVIEEARNCAYSGKLNRVLNEWSFPSASRKSF